MRLFNIAIQKYFVNKFGNYPTFMVLLYAGAKMLHAGKSDNTKG